VKAVLFDFAGTLFMPRGAPEWVRAAAARSGVELPDADVDRLAGEYLAAGLPGAPYPASVPASLAGLYEERDLRPESHRAAYVALLSTVEGPVDGFAGALYDQIFEAGHWIPYPDAAGVVEALVDAGLRVGLISNIAFDVRPVVRAHGFHALAERCTLSFEHEAVKPDAALFEVAFHRLGTAPEETLMVGDNPAADGGAADLGCPTLLLPMTPPGMPHGLERVLRLALAPAPRAP
jgi:FMN phosphatase YigB (HAD superfamily)